MSANIIIFSNFRFFLGRYSDRQAQTRLTFTYAIIFSFRFCHLACETVPSSTKDPFAIWVLNAVPMKTHPFYESFMYLDHFLNNSLFSESTTTVTFEQKSSIFDSFLSFCYHCICSNSSKNIFHARSFWKRMRILRPKNHNPDHQAGCLITHVPPCIRYDLVRKL